MAKDKKLVESRISRLFKRSWMYDLTSEWICDLGEYPESFRR